MTSDGAARRAAARQRRRKVADEQSPPEPEDGAVGAALKSAAAAAAVGAAVGAVRAVTSRGHNDDPAAETDEPDAERDEEPEAKEDVEPDSQEDGQPARPEPVDESPEDARERKPQPEPAREQEPQPKAEPERPAQRRQQGSSPDQVRSIAQTVRDQLRELQGSEAESLTALERFGNGWRATLEVVEVRRVPESTDVLATYAVELDDEGRLVSFERVRRYYRAQADMGGDT